MLRAGAVGFLGKQESTGNRIDTLGAILAGERFISAALAHQFVDCALGGVDVAAAVELMTDRKLQILQMIGKGLTSQQILDRLFICNHTLESHRGNIKRKLCVESAGRLMRRADVWNLAQQELLREKRS